MISANELRRRAGRYLRMMWQITDDRAVQALSELASELEMSAEELEKRQWIRERAHAIWIAEGRPEGRDVEFWVRAERELAGAAQRVRSRA